jgi:hypothetical protein
MNRITLVTPWRQANKNFFFRAFMAARFRLRGSAAPSSGRKTQKLLRVLCHETLKLPVSTYWKFFTKKRPHSVEILNIPGFQPTN